MAPLVPTIISNEFNLIIALIAGIGFGFVLEQAGFSSTKKLVGLFYGYDFTVLKVFFTAGVTAMIGVLLFGHMGILDLSMIYINPTFLWSAIIGGAVMGVGFIIGGFCPGTSICAAAIGKLDGMAFVIGGALGVLAFAEGYPLWEKVYLAEAWGPVTMNNMLGISPVLFAFMLTGVAVAAFYFTSLIENKVNGLPSGLTSQKRKIYASAVAMAFILIIYVAMVPNVDKRLDARIENLLKSTDFAKAEVPADKLAQEIINNYYKINIIDTRSPEAFKAYHLPLALNIPAENIRDRKWDNIWKQKHKANYFYGDDHVATQKAYLYACQSGKAENYILKESSSSFKMMFDQAILPPAGAGKQEMNIYNFRKKASTDMTTLIETLKNSTQPVVAKTTKIKGGC
jgi:rhodanese-related sulfurtransferase